jgi:signal peptidase II
MRAIAFYGVAAAVLAADQATKQWAVRALESEGSVPVISNWLALTLVRNSGDRKSVV